MIPPDEAEDWVNLFALELLEGGYGAKLKVQALWNTKTNELRDVYMYSDDVPRMQVNLPLTNIHKLRLLHKQLGNILDDVDADAERAEGEEMATEMARLEASWALCSRPHNDCSTDRPCPVCGCGYPQDNTNGA